MKKIAIMALLAAALGVPSSRAQAKEEKVTLDELPAAVRATVDAEARGGKLGEIERETKGGKVIYEVDVAKDGKEIEVKIAEDGTVLERKVEEDGDDDK